MELPDDPFSPWSERSWRTEQSVLSLSDAGLPRPPFDPSELGDVRPPFFCTPWLKHLTFQTRRLSSKNRIIPVEEDMRRLFQECKVAEGNAALLSNALAYTKPEDVRGEIVQVRARVSRDHATLAQEGFCAGILHQMSNVARIHLCADSMGNGRC